MRVFPRRGAAMSPRKKHLFLLFVFLLLSGTFYCFPFLLYVTLILAVCWVVSFYQSGEPFPARLGLNPRAWQNVPTALRRWLSGLGATGVSVGIRGKTKHGGNNRVQLRESEGFSGHSGWNRREPLSSDSFLCSPRDFLMGSYIGKPGSPAADPGRPRPGRNPREQLRERLCRPNYAVQTPIRRLSFTGEPHGTFGRFTITPQRHYPLQQPGVSSVGVLPPARWDGFIKKNVLSPRNSPASHSPVTVKIARPNHNTTSMNYLSSPVLSRAATADPCSRESVLRVLKESRKRDVEDEDRSFSTEQKSKRRRNDSGGSSHSAFEPMLPNGTPSQLVPKPGNLKRGISLLAEESIMKRSRTSSISSGSGHAQRGTPGSRRNAIQSSYSSSLALGQLKKRSAPSSPLSSPGSSRCQTPEGLPKRPREDDGPSPSSAASVRSDQASSEKAPDTSKLTPIPKFPVTSSTDSTGSGGKRKRKIQLVSSNRDDHISLPPPPELGYTITVKDLDEEKKAGISKIQKVLETPAPEPEKYFSPQPTTSTQPASTSTSSSTVTLSSLLAAPLPTSSSSVIPVINLDPSPGGSSSSSTATTTTTTTPKAPKSLLEALKMNISSPAGSVVPAASITTVPATSTPLQPSSTMLSPLPSVTASLLPPASQTPSFAQALSQVTKAPIGNTTVTGSGLFGLTSQFSTASSVPNPVPTASVPPPATMVTSSSSSVSGSSTNPLLASEFKPIFTVTTSATTPATDSKQVVQSFKPIFGEASSSPAFGQVSSITNTTSAASLVSLSTTTSVFGGSMSSKTAPPPAYPGLTTTSTPSTGSVTSIQPAVQPAVTSLFGNWSTPSSTSTATVQAQNTGSTFQFGAGPSTATAPAPASTAVSTISAQAPFSFGATKPDPQAATQKVFAFGQAASTQNTTTPSFGGFAMSNAASTTAATTTQSTFAFGKSTFEPPSAPSTFSSSAVAPKPFPFGGDASSSTPASNSAPTPFPFGAPAATSASTFSTPVKPTFGNNPTGFAFGSTTVPSAASPAPPSFGATQTQNAAPAPTFAFGSAGTQPTPAAPAQPATGGFNFSAGLPCPQFGTPVSNNSAPQMGSFNFGAAASDKPTFGTPTPSFGQCTTVGPIPFGSPGTPAQGFSAVPFGGSPAAPSFSIGAGSRPSGSRQRLQARRTRKK